MTTTLPPTDNSCILVGTYGGDKSHCLSAWTSTAEDLGIDLESREVDDRIRFLFDSTVPTKKKSPQELLTFLAREGHHTPFEKSMLHFIVKCDIATHIHLLKHRIGVSINTESARYKEFKNPTFHIPHDWPEEEAHNLLNFCTRAEQEYHAALSRLEPILGRKRAKESARYFLPYATQVTQDISFNFRSFMHFVGLRTTEHAQTEIRILGKQMIEQVRKTGKFTMSLNAFNSHA